MDKVLQLSSEELKKLIDNNSNFLLLDVRSPEEYERGRIKGSVNIPYELVGEKLSLLVPDKKTKIVVYCLSGSRSIVAALKLLGLGYVDVWDLTGGLLTWRAKGYPTE
jgi:phage shock protein E